MTEQTPPEHLVKAFADVADLTAPKCGQCRAPHNCCSRAQCEETRTFAKETFGIDLPETDGPLPFLGENGCTVAPHLRPICAVHVCESHLRDAEFADLYEDLRETAATALEDVLAEIGTG